LAQPQGQQRDHALIVETKGRFTHKGDRVDGRHTIALAAACHQAEELRAFGPVAREMAIGALNQNSTCAARACA